MAVLGAIAPTVLAKSWASTCSHQETCQPLPFHTETTLGGTRLRLQAGCLDFEGIGTPRLWHAGALATQAATFILVLHSSRVSRDGSDDQNLQDRSSGYDKLKAK